MLSFKPLEAGNGDFSRCLGQVQHFLSRSSCGWSHIPPRELPFLAQHGCTVVLAVDAVSAAEATPPSAEPRFVWLAALRFLPLPGR